MTTAKAYYDGRVFVPITPVNVKKNQAVIISIEDAPSYAQSKNPYLDFAGSLVGDNYKEIIEILHDTERVDTNEW